MIDPTELTPEQEKAWKSLKRAFKKCESANIYWYQVLDFLSPLNGDVVQEVDDHCHRQLPEGAFDLCDGTVSIQVTCSFADDAHHAILK